MSVKDQLKWKDEYCTEFVEGQIAAVKKFFGINQSKRVYALDWWVDRYYFLCDDRVYAVYFDYEGDKYPYIPIVESAYIITLKNGEVADFKMIKPDDTTPEYNEVYGVKFDETRKCLTQEFFKIWYDSPCRVNEFVNVPYSKAIEFLQNYKKTTFHTNKYLFYAKRDNDLTWAYYIYAYDLKNKAEMKIYIDDCYIDTYFPEKLRNIYVKDLSGKLSDYQKLQCKKAFFEYCKQECTELKAPNFYAMEFVKQCIQPIEKDRGWWITKPHYNDTEFELGGIWIDDTLMYDEKPYFLVTNHDRSRYTTKIAAIDFLKSAYKSTEPYVSDYTKWNHWEMTKDELKRLTEFLAEPFDYKKTIYFKQHGKFLFGPEYKLPPKCTNWQQLIEEYNRNTSQYGEKRYDGKIFEELPLDLPMPDYTKILENNSNTKE